jgi:hypothetical protein
MSGCVLWKEHCSSETLPLAQKILQLLDWEWPEITFDDLLS